MIDALQTAAALCGGAGARGIHQKPPHDPCRDSEEVGAVLLRAVKGRRLAAPTAYNDELNERLGRFLSESGFEVLAMKGLSIERLGEPGEVAQEDLQKIAVSVFRMAATSDAMLLSCGGFNTIDRARGHVNTWRLKPC